jgi:hypothetical protein
MRDTGGATLINPDKMNDPRVRVLMREADEIRAGLDAAGPLPPDHTRASPTPKQVEGILRLREIDRQIDDITNEPGE